MIEPDEKKDKEINEQAKRAERSRRVTVGKDAFLTVIVDMFTSISRADVAQAAAAISYYSLFSLFPMLLFVIIFLSYFVDIATAQEVVYDFLGTIGPWLNTIIIENIQGIFEKRASTSITAALTLLWSGSGAFSSIIKNIHNAWPESRGRGILVNRALAIIGILLAVLVLAAVLFVSLLNDLFDWNVIIPILRYPIVSWLFSALLNFVLPLALLYLVLYLLYRYIPAVAVDRSAARIASLIVTILLILFSQAFSAFLVSPFNKYDAVYGSVTVIITLLLFIYISAFLILCGGHLTAAITHYRLKWTTGETESKPVPEPQKKSSPKKKATASVQPIERAYNETTGRVRRWVRERRREDGSFFQRCIAKIDAMRRSEKWQQTKNAAANLLSNLFRWK